MQKYEHDIQKAERIKLSWSRSTLTVIVRKGTSSVNSVKVIVNYAGTFRLQYGLRFEDARRRDIVSDAVSFHYIATSSSVTYNRHVRCDNPLIVNQDPRALL